MYGFNKKNEIVQAIDLAQSNGGNCVIYMLFISFAGNKVINCKKMIGFRNN